VAGCYDQNSLVEYVRGKDPAMVNAVEEPSAITPTGECEVTQRTEARSHQRNDVSVKRGKACDTLKDNSSSDAGDGSCVIGGTKESLKVHSQLEDMGSRYKTLNNQHKTEKV
jgi:hypothetical protein